VDAYFSYGKYQFDFNQPLRFAFFVNKNKGGTVDYELIVSTGELQSSSNQFMTSDGLAIIFNDVQELDDFLNKISIQKIDAFLAKPKTDALFK